MKQSRCLSWLLTIWSFWALTLASRPWRCVLQEVKYPPPPPKKVKYPPPPPKVALNFGFRADGKPRTCKLILLSGFIPVHTWLELSFCISISLLAYVGGFARLHSADQVYLWRPAGLLYCLRAARVSILLSTDICTLLWFQEVKYPPPPPKVHTWSYPPGRKAKHANAVLKL